MAATSAADLQVGRCYVGCSYLLRLAIERDAAMCRKCNFSRQPAMYVVPELACCVSTLQGLLSNTANGIEATNRTASSLAWLWVFPRANALVLILRSQCAPDGKNTEAVLSVASERFTDQLTGPQLCAHLAAKHDEKQLQLPVDHIR